MKTAKLIKKLDSKKELYELSEEVESHGCTSRFVVVSEAGDLVPPETLGFLATKEGKILDWLETFGRIGNGYVGNDILSEKGYTILEEAACSTETP